MTENARIESEREKPRAGLLFNPYFHIFLSTLLATAAQLCLKKGSSNVTSIWLGIEGLRSGWVWLGILAMVSGLFSWLYGLRFVPLNIAFNLGGMVLVLVPLGSWLLLGERIGLTRGCGIVLVCAGVATIAGPLMRVEERL